MIVLLRLALGALVFGIVYRVVTVVVRAVNAGTMSTESGAVLIVAAVVIFLGVAFYIDWRVTIG